MKKIIPVLFISVLLASCASTPAASSNPAGTETKKETAAPAPAAKTTTTAVEETVSSVAEDEVIFKWGKNIENLLIDGSAVGKKDREAVIKPGFHRLNFSVVRKESLMQYGGRADGLMLGYNFIGGLTYNFDIFFSGMKFTMAIRPDLPYLVTASKFYMKSFDMPALEREIEFVDANRISRPYKILGNVKSTMQCNAIYYKKVTDVERNYKLKEACQTLEADALMNVFSYSKTSATNDWVTEAIAIKYTD